MAMMFTRKSLFLLNLINKSLWDLPTPSTISYFWNFGSMLGICLVLQILTGLFLSFFYSSFHTESFLSVVMIMKEVWGGWMIRLIHMNGASMFFMFIYLHMFRGLFYMSTNNKMTWNSGVMILMILMAISFMGYVLPWGQMSYWAVAVITNLFSVIPIVGESVVQWIWGGFSVSKPTLMRFYSLHFLTPLILSMVVMAHLYFLHKNGSSNQMSLPSNSDKLSFHPYFTVKDLMFILLALTVMLLVSTIYPYLTLDPENNIPANPMQTPLHIQPEWYFLPFYTILRAMPSKSAGVIGLISSILILMALPMMKTKFSVKFNFYRMMNYWVFLASFLMLMKLGALPAEEPYIEMGIFWTSLYFTSIISMNI